MKEKQDFSWALKLLKENKKIQRSGWNGKGMYLVYKPGYPNGVPANEATAKAHGIEVGTTIVYCPYIEMKTVGNELIPWLASQADILAEDWQLVE
jgi:hypothetical protein